MDIYIYKMWAVFQLGIVQVGSVELVNLKAFSRWKGRLGNATISAVHATSVNKRMDFIIYPLGLGTFIIGLFC